MDCSLAQLFPKYFFLKSFWKQDHIKNIPVNIYNIIHVCIYIFALVSVFKHTKNDTQISYMSHKNKGDSFYVYDFFYLLPGLS